MPARQSKRENFQKINEFLCDTVSSSDFEKNMAKASELLERQARAKTPDESSFVEDLRSLVALNSIRNKCDRTAYEMLRAICEATDYRGHKEFRDLGPLRRIDSIVYHYSKQHYEDCKQVYPRLFVALYNQVDEAQRKRWDIMAKRMLNYYWPDEPFMPKDKLQLERFIEGSLRSEHKYVGSNSLGAFYLMEQLAGDAKDPDAIHLTRRTDERRGNFLPMNRAKVEALAKRYVIDPCKLYVNTLGPNIFEPWQFDSLMVEEEERYVSDLDILDKDESQRQFNIGLIRFKFCKSLIHEEEMLVTNVLELTGAHIEDRLPTLLGEENESDYYLVG
mgnify:CR=1 FL=1